MKRWTVGLVAAVSVVASMSCSSGEVSSVAEPTTTPSGSAPSGTASSDVTPSTTGIGSTFAAGDRYVALGSSIASGYGISVQSTDCGRSNRNYPNLIAERYGLALTDVTCGAATIPNVVDTPQGAFPPQITALTPDTKLITVSVGGNDIGYNATAVGCADPASECTAPAALDEKLVTTRDALLALLEQIHTIAPSATVVLVTYPREVPAGNCPELSFSDAEAAIVRSMGEQLEAMLVSVAEEADVVSVDPYPLAADHTGCAAPAERWTAGSVAEDGFAYHPTALGHEVMAQLIADQLGS